MYCSQPCATAVDGAYRFFQNLTQVSDTVFGFTAFSVSPLDAVGPQYGTGANTSIWLSTPQSPAANTSVYSPFVWQGTSLINPNFWVWSPLTLGQAGPAASPINIPYSSNYNASGPNQTTWLSISASGAPTGSAAGPPASTNSGQTGVAGWPAWGFINWGFQIPRSPLVTAGSSSDAYNASYYSFAQCAAPGMWSSYNFTGSGNSFPTGGYHGLFHCTPLYGTEALEALNNAYTQLDDYSSVGGGFTGTSNGPGAKQAVVFFTDGVPTDDSTPFPNYKTMATKFSQIGCPVYAIGLSLNNVILQEQGQLLYTLTNKGAYGSNYSQVAGEANLLSSFTAMARQLSTCTR